MFLYKPGVEQVNLTSKTLLTQIRIVVSAFILGVVIFAGVGAFMLFSSGTSAPAPGPTGVPVPSVPPPGPLPSTSTIAGFNPVVLVMFVMMFTMPMAFAFAISKASGSRARKLWQERRDDVEAGRMILNIYGQLTITGAAMMEGIGLLGGVVVFVFHDPLGFIGVGFALLTLAAIFPSENRLNTFIRRATESVVPV
ncbi:MAG: hypothetical protein IBJ18_12205 [Phycisphaerales bacterium]|nr:hypothetical protein [Phycisphaerales bacterium]